ncbi:serine/threonine protein kinase [Paenibacillus flagellatus]|uniref:non-specific serine/threonine protein kinase n=1 Tax=Paenibacillus flagellatus TaxID=2211139 RepID=A0A2V5KCE3_9BACL|nr:serine/threonine-protein kinase [Paenibacillus flagellatus]PYI57275.1 hypothetical protein DLM86_02195 [Paenibacillus flagellatus]
MRNRIGKRLEGIQAAAGIALQRLREAALDRPLRPGAAIGGRYRVERVLGIGSYGISYLCADLHDEGAPCVVKQVKPSKRGGRKGKPIFEREAATLAALDHPGVPKLLGRFRERRDLFLVMEYKRGRNLEDVLFADERTFALPEALRLLRRLSDIVAYVHRAGFVHRDIRIPNVMLREDGTLALIDFGLACPVSDEPVDGEETERYAEEKRIRREPVAASDFYALGHFLLFLLYAEFEPKENEPERGWEEELDLPSGVRRFIRRLLQLDEPFGDIGEVVRELDRLIEQTPAKPE